MAIGNEELVHECFPKLLRIGIARMKVKETEEDKKRGMGMERSKASPKKDVPMVYNYLIKIEY